MGINKVRVYTCCNKLHVWRVDKPPGKCTVCCTGLIGKPSVVEDHTLFVKDYLRNVRKPTEGKEDGTV